MGCGLAVTFFSFIDDDVVREWFESFIRMFREFLVSALRMVFLVGDGEDGDVGDDTRSNAVSNKASGGHEGVAV